jgi:hypothetical protein
MRTQPRFPVPQSTSQWLGRFITTMSYLGEEVDWYYSLLFQRVTVIHQVPASMTFVPPTDPTAHQIKTLYEVVRDEFNHEYEKLAAEGTTPLTTEFCDRLIEEILTEHVNRVFHGHPAPQSS